MIGQFAPPFGSPQGSWSVHSRAAGPNSRVWGKVYKVFRYAITSARSWSESWSSKLGMPSGLPLLINSITLASVTFFLLFRFAFLNTPFRPGPTFVSALSALWQTSQFDEKVSL